MVRTRRGPLMLQRLQLALITGLGVGYSPVAPGTCGTALGMLVAWGLAPLATWLYVVTTVAAIALSCWLAERGRVHFGVDDPSHVVIDEVVAMLLVMAGHPWKWWVVLTAFAAFRLFDIWKPWPVRNAEHLPGGLGIVADDLVAAGYAWLVVWLVRRVVE